MESTPQLIPLEQADIAASGGKARNLARLIALGIQVPKGVVVACGKQMRDQNEARALAEQICSLLQPPFIARSSANIEDAIATSFAGLFASQYPITTVEELAAAILRIQSSLYSNQVRAYLKHYNILLSSVRVSVLVQEYKTAQLSGVVFTTDPEDKARMVVEMAGKVSGVMAGDITPQRIYIQKKMAPVQQDDITSRLFEISSQIEKEFGRAQDIEWVYANQALWIVQSRPTVGANLNLDTVAQAELQRLRTRFGAKVPYFAASQFADAVEVVTPSTMSLLQKIFSAEGAWGKLMRMYYGTVSRSFTSENYVTDIFGRLFVNKDLEKEMFSRGFFRKAIGTARLQMHAFRQFKRIPKQITKLETEILKLEGLAVGKPALKRTLDHLVQKTSFLLLQAGMFQQLVLQYLEKRIHPYVTEQEWQEVLGSRLEDTLLQALHNSGSNTKTLLQKVGHRGFQELEFSQPRWREDPDAFRELIAKHSENHPLLAQQHGENREKILSRFLSMWERQQIATRFSLYDEFSTYREQLHDLWIREISRLRDLLLVMDREAQWYNSIWYLSLDEIIAKSSKQTGEELLERRRFHEFLRRIPLRGTIQVKSWNDLLRHRKVPKKKMYKGSGLTFGYAEGIAGTIENLRQGERVDILVVKNLDPAIVLFYDQIKGVITEVGGQLSHATIVAREYGIPVMALENATQVFPPGSKISLNCQTGVIA